MDCYQIHVKDPLLLSGPSVFQFVEPIIRRLSIRTIVVSDLEGLITGLPRLKRKVFSSDEFLEKVQQAVQYEWGFLHFFSDKLPGENFDSLNNKAAIQTSYLTVQFVDNEYFYVYGKDRKTIDDLRATYPSSEFNIDKFDELVLPA